MFIFYICVICGRQYDVSVFLYNGVHLITNHLPYVYSVIAKAAFVLIGLTEAALYQQ